MKLIYVFKSLSGAEYDVREEFFVPTVDIVNNGYVPLDKYFVVANGATANYHDLGNETSKTTVSFAR